MTFKTICHLAYKNLQYTYFKLTNQVEKIIPYKVLIEVTNHCNSKCLHCDIWKIEKEDITAINLEKLEPFLSKMGRNLLWLAFSGGEVSIYRQFPALIALVKKYNPALRIVAFTTNGLMPQKILTYALMIRDELKCDMFITISLDGDEETHDLVRGVNGNYQKAQETYQLLKQNNIPCQFGITISHTNYSFIQNFFKDYRESIKAVTFLHTSGIFLTKDEPVAKENDQKILEAMTTIYKNYKISSLGEILVKVSIKLGILFVKEGRKTNVIPCDVGLSSVHLMSNGNIQPCMYMPAIASIGESFELSSFHTEKAKEIQTSVKNDHCPHCWMQCYAPHSMLQSPLKSAALYLKSV